jgi:hypothetical protein
MKALTLLTLALILSAPAHAASGTLNCWKTDFHPAKPFMTATIDRKNTLSDITFNYKNTDLENADGPVKGEEITTNHSPYKGNVRFSVKGVGDLILPADLSNENLESVEASGIGYFKNENGVIISSIEGDGDGGNHISYRLSCRSDL